MSQPCCATIAVTFDRIRCSILNLRYDTNDLFPVIRTIYLSKLQWKISYSLKAFDRAFFNIPNKIFNRFDLNSILGGTSALIR